MLLYIKTIKQFINDTDNTVKSKSSLEVWNSQTKESKCKYDFDVKYDFEFRAK